MINKNSSLEELETQRRKWISQAFFERRFEHIFVVAATFGVKTQIASMSSYRLDFYKGIYQKGFGVNMGPNIHIKAWRMMESAKLATDDHVTNMLRSLITETSRVRLVIGGRIMVDMEDSAETKLINNSESLYIPGEWIDAVEECYQIAVKMQNEIILAKNNIQRERLLDRMLGPNWRNS